MFEPMLKNLSDNAQPILTAPYILRTRRNHGLEHATVHVLSDRVKSLSIAGRSDAAGFWLIGDVTTEQVESAVHDALERMQKGEHHLAVHPNCGTGLLTTGTLVSLAALAGSIGVKRGARDYVNRFPLVLMMSIGAVILAQPLGLSLQEHFTTEGNPGNLSVLKVERSELHTPLSNQPMTVHRVTTTST